LEPAPMVVGKHSNPRTDRQSWPWCHIAQLQKHSCIRIASSFPRPRDAWFGLAGTATNRNYVIYQRKAAPVDKIQEGCHHSASEYFVTVVTTSPVQVGVRTPGVLLAGPSRATRILRLMQACGSSHPQRPGYRSVPFHITNILGFGSRRQRWAGYI
jgi:hypothetical protein